MLLKDKAKQKQHKIGGVGEGTLRREAESRRMGGGRLVTDESGN